MPRLTAAQLLELDILSNEQSGDDSEFDNVEIDFRNEDGESEEEGTDDDVVGTGSIKKDFNAKIRTETIEQTRSGSNKRNADAMCDDNMFTCEENTVLYGGINKKNPHPFEWYVHPNKIFTKKGFRNTRVIHLLHNEKSIEIFFKKIITPEIVNLIAKYTNKKIDLIDNRNLKNDEYKLKRDRLIENEVSSQEIYAFIGVLILLGITKKSNESIESLWNSNSLHYASFAAATMSRDRFQLLSRYITFDDLDTRVIRKNYKFHKMQEIFDAFKSNLQLIIPSNSLCVDEELYAFRGQFRFCISLFRCIGKSKVVCDYYLTRF